MPARPLAPRLFAAAGALACGLAVALAAYASHGLAGEAAGRAGLAALFAFGHGLALQWLGRGEPGHLRLLACVALAIGMLLFTGSLAGAVFFGWPTRLAPAGGSLLMLGWVLAAIDHLRS